MIEFWYPDIHNGYVLFLEMFILSVRAESAIFAMV